MLSEGDGSIVLHGYGNDSRDALKYHCRIVDYADSMPQKLAMSGKPINKPPYFGLALPVRPTP